MADDLTLVARLSANASEFVGAMGKAAKAAEGFAKDAQKEFKSVADNLDSMGRQAKDVGLKMGAMGAAIIAPLGLAGREAAQFGRGLADVASLGVRDIDRLGDELQDLRQELGLNTDGTKELYNAISAGIAPDAAIGVLEQAAKGARAGVGSLNVALDAGTSLLNSYGLATGNAAEVTGAMAEVQGQLVTAVKFGKTTMDELGGSIGRIAPLAAQAGVDSSELLAAIAALTTTGASAKEQVTSLRQTIANILKPTAEAVEVAEELGIEFNATALESKGLVGFLRDVRDTMDSQGISTAEQTEKMTKLFGSVESLNAVLGLLSGPIGEKFDVAFADMTQSTKNLDDAVEASIENDPSLAYNQLSASVSALSQDVGKAVNESFAPLADELTDIVQKTREWVEANPELSASLAGVSGAVGVLFVALGGLGFAIGGFASGIAALMKLGPVLLAVGGWLGEIWMGLQLIWGSMGFILAGIGAFAAAAPAAFALIIFGIALLVTHWSDFWSGVWTIAKGALGLVWDIVSGFFDLVWTAIKTVWYLILSFFQIITGDFSGAVESWKKIGGAWYDLFSGWIDGLLTRLQDLWQTAKDVAAFVFSTLDDGELKSDRIPDQVLAKAKALRKAGRNDEAKALLNQYAAPTPNIPALATGGIVTRPTLAYVGEAGPEAVIPLERMGSITNDNSNVTIQVYGDDPRATAEAVFEIIQRRKLT